MARLYREAPLNAIWEGTSNMMCMDVLRACGGMQAAGMPSSTSSDEKGPERILAGTTEDLADRLRAQYPDDGHARRSSTGWHMRCSCGCCSMAMPMPPIFRAIQAGE